MPSCNDRRHEGATHGDAITFIVVPSRCGEESQDHAAAPTHFDEDDDCDDGHHTPKVRSCSLAIMQT